MAVSDPHSYLVVRHALGEQLQDGLLSLGEIAEVQSCSPSAGAVRRDRAKEAAQKVPVKILLPVIACFLPGIFIIVLGPATLSLFRLFSSL